MVHASNAGEQGRLFEPPASERVRLQVAVPTHRVWTENKARIISNYLALFQIVTKHGTYIDGFAGMHDRPESWAARLVVEIEPARLDPLYLVDADFDKVRQLEELRSRHPSRDIKVIHGDFNRVVHEILESGAITERTAAFCLIDQFSTDCRWSTVRALADHPKESYKIEQFYFLPNLWLPRALASVTEQRGRDWWGRDDWSELRGMHALERADMLAQRFEDELGYLSAIPWPIYERGEGGRISYFMIHATDHPRAVKLMELAYRDRIPTAETLRMFEDDPYDEG